jgi:outer membrane protein assembly factor BamB
MAAALLVAGTVVVGAQPARAATGDWAATGGWAATGDWAQPGYSAANTAYNPAESVINAGSIKKLKARWSVTPAASHTSCIGQTPPVVAGGRVFLPAGDGVSAYSAATGAFQWHAKDVFDEGAGPLLAVAGNTLIGTTNFCFSNSDSNGDMVALDVRTGRKRWTASRDTPYDSIVVDAGLVIASGAEFAADFAAVTAYRVGDGSVKWQRTEMSAENGVSAGGRLLLAEADGTGSIAVSAATGAKVWTSAKSWTVQGANPAGDRFYATDPAGRLTAIAAATGATGWTVPGGLVTNDGRQVFVARGNGLTCYTAATGKKKWSRDLGGAVGRPVRAGGLVYAAVDGRPMAILAAATGATVASGKPYRKAWGHPVVTGGRLYVNDGTKLHTYTP